MITVLRVTGPGWSSRIGMVLAATAVAGGSMLAAPRPAAASPVSPGNFEVDYFAPFCGAPQPAPGRPGWSRVRCAEGVNQFVVPAGVHALALDVVGAAGGRGGGGAAGGRGERVRASIAVTPGEALEMVAGSAGSSREKGGFNGGGDGPRYGATGPTASGGGGGSSDVRVGDAGYTDPTTRVITAAGGGGGGGSGGGAGGTPSGTGSPGGAGGGPGHAGAPAAGSLGGAGGGGATSSGSGAGGGSGAAAVRAGRAGNDTGLFGGRGGRGDRSAPGAGDGGAGGGGAHFGGGGAGGSVAGGSGTAGGGGGGGGGSSAVDSASLVPGTRVVTGPGPATGNGSITITYDAPPIACGDTIYVTTTLTTDLDCRGKPGLIMSGVADPLWSANGPVVLDLGGHTIRGDGTNTGIDIRHTFDTVRDGTLAGFKTGVLAHAFEASEFEQGGPATYVGLSRLQLTGGRVGVALDSDGALYTQGLDATVDHVVIGAMSDAGIRSYGTGDLSLAVTDSTITGSGLGISAGGGETDLRADVITGNAGPGLTTTSPFVHLVDNVVTGNGSGVTVTPDPFYDNSSGEVPGAVTIVGNVVGANAGTGITLSGSIDDADVLAYNVTDDNGRALVDPGAGIRVRLGPSGTELTVTADSASGNRGWGIDAPGVSDGGGNTASGNARGQQCRGVECD